MRPLWQILLPKISAVQAPCQASPKRKSGYFEHDNRRFGIFCDRFETRIGPEKTREFFVSSPYPYQGQDALAEYVI